mgnify:CR=1 FL=1
MASLPSTDDAAKRALEEERKKRLLAGRGDLGGGGTVDPTSSAPIEAKGAEGATFGASGTKEFADEPFGEEGAATKGKDPLEIGGAEGEAVSALRESGEKAKQRETQKEGSRISEQAAEEVRQEELMEQTAGQTREEQKKISGQAKKKAGRLPKKAEKVAKKGAAATPAAEAAVESVAESVAGAGEGAAPPPVSEAVTGGGPTKSIQPAGRVEEMSLRQLRQRERGRGVAGILGTGGARGDVQRRMRQGTIHTEGGQEALQGFEESREAREAAQQAKREARAVLRGGEYTPSGPGGFRVVAQEAAKRATAASEVLDPKEAGAKAPARRTAPKVTPDVEETVPLGSEGYSDDPELDLPPVSPIEEEQFSEVPGAPTKPGSSELEQFWGVPEGTPMGSGSEDPSLGATDEEIETQIRGYDLSRGGGRSADPRARTGSPHQRDHVKGLLKKVVTDATDGELEAAASILGGDISMADIPQGVSAAQYLRNTIQEVRGEYVPSPPSGIESPTGPQPEGVESSLDAFNAPSSAYGSFMAGATGHRGRGGRDDSMYKAIIQTDPGTEGPREMARDLSALMHHARVPEGMPPEDYMRFVIDTYRDVSPNFRHNYGHIPGQMWGIKNPQVIGEAKRMFAAELSARIDAGSSPL